MPGAALFSSHTCEWATPTKLFAQLAGEFSFKLDVCATAQNAKCHRYFTLRDNAIFQPWAPEVCWMNPPYGPDLPTWMKKAWEESRRGATVVCLVPARTDTAWWHDFALQAAEIRFIRGRLRFGETGGKATFPSVLVVFKPGTVQ